MRRKGLERRKPCGRRTADLVAARSEAEIEVEVAALRTIALDRSVSSVLVPGRSRVHLLVNSSNDRCYQQ